MGLTDDEIVNVSKTRHFKTKSTRSSSNKWTKILYQDYLHCNEDFCRALFNIF